MSFRSARGRMICRIGSVVALIAFFLPWVSSPFLSIGYGLSGSIDQAELNGGKLFEMLGQSQLTLDGRTEAVTGGPTLSYGMPLIILCLLFSLGISFYRSRSPVAERNIAAALLGTGVLCTLVVVIACAVYCALSASLRRGSGGGDFSGNGVHSSMRRTEVRPICRRRAISALLTPAHAASVLGWCETCCGGPPSRWPFCLACAKPARTRSRRMSRSNSAKTLTDPPSPVPRVSSGPGLP